MPPRSAALTCLLALALAVGEAWGEEPTPPKASGQVAFSVAGGGAFGAVPIFGGVSESGRQAAFFELQMHRSLKRTASLEIEYLFALVPLELQGATLVREGEQERRVTSHAAGFDPLGLRFVFPGGAFRPFGMARGGIRFFDEVVPEPRGTRLNFVAELGVGLSRRLGGAYDAWLGLTLHHVSNANRGVKNYGINQFALNLGLLWRRRAAR